MQTITPAEARPMTLLQDTSHRRFNALTREWVLVSPHRTQRPWQGQIERPAQPAALATIPNVISAPATGARTATSTPITRSTLVFDNDFPALRLDAQAARVDRGGLIVAEAESGVCRVICFSPRHDLTLARMSVEEIEPVVRVWAEQYRELGGLEAIGWVQIFENRGAMMGASNPHPHCQIWASQSLPNEAAKELASQTAYRLERRGCLLCDYLELELASRRARGLRERAFRRVGAVLGGVAVRDARAAASAFRRHGRTERRGERGAWPTSCAL